jgi:hypothetical protein
MLLYLTRLSFRPLTPFLAGEALAIAVCINKTDDRFSGLLSRLRQEGRGSRMESAARATTVGCQRPRERVLPKNRHGVSKAQIGRLRTCALAGGVLPNSHCQRLTQTEPNSSHPDDGQTKHDNPDF